MSIAVAVLTHNRAHLLRECVENVLSKTSEATTEIVIWNNASTDGTRAYLDSLDDPRLLVVHHPENIGQSAYGRAFALTEAPYLVELDDDVVDAPAWWDDELLHAFELLPDVGFLAADLEDDPHDVASRVRHHERPDAYTPYEENGVRLLAGPTGGGCAITSRELCARAGGFRESDDVFFLEDEAYIEDLARLGYRAAVLQDLRVLHHGGPYYSGPNPHREAYWRARESRQARRNSVKKALLGVPLVRPLNARYQWFTEPA